MSYAFYKVLHLLGLMLLFFALGGYTLQPPPQDDDPGAKRRRIVLAVSHGVGLLIMLVAGFGLLAKLKLTGGVPTWAWLKVGLWLALGAAPAVIKRTPAPLRLVWAALPLVGTLAVYLAIHKP